MTSLILVAVTIARLTPSDLEVAKVVLWFVALQSCLAYFASGAAKLFGASWRDGSAVFLIFSTRAYGLPRVREALARHATFAKFVTWSVVAVETLFPLVLLMPEPYIWLVLGWGVTFHLLNALIMGLNSFVWAFLATYPAILFCAAQST